ncbi:hypothetical protein RFI_09711 [Reticulomyxa filosa]|uniref:Uncharacterized protein n=1 Tax=Reticulomyxa filosa TaxID=46433 RepID=X6NMF3_RETFI|nr:hypothetical protein RFI_09711 [Reticulomyxa filosa]|eukprot:ETO27420.1 hypothetical protein RFI_09711 [Reticulomyxa filosa]
MRERGSNKSFQINDDECRRLVDSIAKDNSIFFHNVIIRKETATKFERIWNCKGIQNTFEHFRKQHVMDNTPYFLNQISQLYINGDDQCNKIKREDMRYVPSWDDYLRVRDQTTGVVTYTITSKVQNRNWMFRLIDVGGQKSERKKWVNVFHDVGVVVYVMSLNAYDQMSNDDPRVKCFDEAFDVFRQVASNPVFQSTDFFLFLNKIDLFEEKIKDVPFTLFDSSFDDSLKNDPTGVIQYVKARYKAIWNDCPEEWQEKRALFFHLTCSVNTSMMQSTIASTNVVLIKRKMQKASIL